MELVALPASDLDWLVKGWAESYLHELRGPDGKWIKDNDKLLAAATGRRAGSVRVHDHVLYAKTEHSPDRTGYYPATVRPMEVTHVAHHWEGTGKNRKRFTDMTLHDPDTDEEISQSVKDGSSVKLFPREAVRALGKPHGGVATSRPPKPVPLPKPKPEPPAPPNSEPKLPVRVLDPVSHASSPGEPFGYISIGSDTVIPDIDTRTAAKMEVQHALNLQGKFIPHIASDQSITISRTSSLSGAQGQTLPSGHIMLAAYDADAVGNVTREVKGLTPSQLQKREQDMGWWVPSDSQYSLMDTTVAHEEGHAIVDHLKTDFISGPDLWGPVAEAIGAPKPGIFHDAFNGKPRVDMDSWLLFYNPQVSKSVSKYATANVHELEAELWSEYTMNAHPRAPAKVYGDLILAELQKEGIL